MKHKQILAAIILATPCIASAETNVLENAGALKPTITLSDSYTDKLVRFFSVTPVPPDEQDETTRVYTNTNEIPGIQKTITYPKTYSAGMQTVVRTSVKIVIPNLVKPDGTPLHTADVTEDTTVTVQVGDLKLLDATKLGDEEGRGVWAAAGTVGGVEHDAGDPKPLGATALYKIGSFVDDLDANFQVKQIKDPEDPTAFIDAPQKFAQTGQVTLAWTLSPDTVVDAKAGKTLVITYTNVATFGEGDEDLASAWSNRFTSALVGTRSISKFVNQPIPVKVTFGDATGKRLIYGNGISKARVNRAHGEQVSRTLRSTSLIAAADVTGPNLSVIKPQAPAAPASVGRRGVQQPSAPEVLIDSDPESFGVDFFGTVQDLAAPTYPGVLTEEDADGLVANKAPKLEILINEEKNEDDDLNYYAVDYTDKDGITLTSPGTAVDPDSGLYSTAVLNSLGLGYFAGFADLSTLDGSLLPIGTNTLTFRATDSDGNVTVVTRRVKGAPAADVYQKVGP